MTKSRPKRMNVTKSRTNKPPAGFINYPLGIKRVVRGREKKPNGRVVYITDPNGSDTKKDISENVVLKRWRHQKLTNCGFSGIRLNPKIWRSLGKIFGNNPGKWASLTVEDITNFLQMGRASNPSETKAIPGAITLSILFNVCGPENLCKIYKRHSDPSRDSFFGTPDLFLYTVNLKTKKIQNAHFVEVKRPDERLSDDQIDEIAFLQSLGLQAGVYRLIEKN